MTNLIFFKEQTNKIILSDLVKILNVQDETFITQISFNKNLVRVYVAYGPSHCFFMKEIIILENKIISTNLPKLEKYKLVYDFLINGTEIINDYDFRKR